MYIRNTKLVILISVAVIVIGMATAILLGKKQDEHFAEEAATYHQANSAYNAKDYDQALQLITPLVEEHAQNEKINYLASLISYSAGYYADAAKYAQTTLDLNPHRVEKPMFMLRLGLAYFSAKDYEKARIVFQYCLDQNFQPEDMPNYREMIEEYIAKIPNN